MNDWAVLLFGHYKPRYYLLDKGTGILVSQHVTKPTDFDKSRLRIHNVIDWEKRAEPGDFTTHRPWDERWRYTPTERKGFLIIRVTGPTDAQMLALRERLYDTSSESWDVGPADGIKLGKKMDFFPRRHLHKRRFKVPLDDLIARGVDLDSMLNKEMEYVPSLEAFDKFAIWDKLRDRYIIASDGLNTIAPITITGTQVITPS
jgi:hypothetical protein